MSETMNLPTSVFASQGAEAEHLYLLGWPARAIDRLRRELSAGCARTFAAPATARTSTAQSTSSGTASGRPAEGATPPLCDSPCSRAPRVSSNT